MLFRTRIRPWATVSVVAITTALSSAGGCSASNSSKKQSSGGAAGMAATGGTGNTSTGGVGAGLIDAAPNDAPLTEDAACAQFSAEAEQPEAAILIVLDRSSSMITNNKWLAAQTAIPQAIDLDAFDDITLGLLAYPAVAQVPSPQCLSLLIPSVSCGVPPLPNVPLQMTGTDKSNAASGVRREIRDWLLANGPDMDPADASPGFEAMQKGIETLRALPIDGKRIMLFVSDGGFSCASLGNGGQCFGQPCGQTNAAPHPTRPGYCDGACWDWEYPDTVIPMLSAAFSDATAPVSTFIVGVPGSNSIGTAGAPLCAMQGPYAIAPYAMRLALSAYAFAGSPTTVPANCDGTAFNINGGEPSTPCHYDMTKQGFFDASSFAQIIEDIRGAALDCVFALPEPPPGETIDDTKVNVNIETDGTETNLARRSDPTDDCSADGCWDYGSDGQVELVGKACDDIKAATNAKVDILVGCATLVK